MIQPRPLFGSRDQNPFITWLTRLASTKTSQLCRERAHIYSRVPLFGSSTKSHNGPSLIHVRGPTSRSVCVKLKESRCSKKRTKPKFSGTYFWGRGVTSYEVQADSGLRNKNSQEKTSECLYEQSAFSGARFRHARGRSPSSSRS